MASQYSAEYTKAFQNVPSEKIDSGKQGASVEIAQFNYDVAVEGGGVALTTSDELLLMKLPKGAILIDFVIYSDDMGTTGDANIGWDGGANSLETADPNGILAAVDVNAADVVHRMSDIAATAETGMLKEFLDEVNIKLVPSENFTATTGKIKGYALYSIA